MFTNTSSGQVSCAVWTKHYHLTQKGVNRLMFAINWGHNPNNHNDPFNTSDGGQNCENLSMFYSHHLPAGAAGVKKCEKFDWNSHFDVKGNLGGSWATRHNKTQHKRTQLNTKEHNTTQSNTMQQNTTQHLKGMVGREPGCWHSCQPH